MEPVGVVRHWEGVALSSSATRMYTVLDIPMYTVHPYRDVWQLQVGFLSGFGSVGVTGLSFLATLGGVNSVVTFFLRRGGFLMRVNCSVSVVVAASLYSLLEVVLLVLAAGFLSLSLLEVTVLL
jgi:hypothetical protein